MSVWFSIWHTCEYRLSAPKKKNHAVNITCLIWPWLNWVLIGQPCSRNLHFKVCLFYWRIFRAISTNICCKNDEKRNQVQKQLVWGITHTKMKNRLEGVIAKCYLPLYFIAFRTVLHSLLLEMFSHWSSFEVVKFPYLLRQCLLNLGRNQ